MPKGRTPAEVSERLSAVGEDLSDRYVELSLGDYGYGDGNYARLLVKGKRSATPDEVRWIEWQRSYQAAQHHVYEQQQIDQLKAARPELFKEDA